MASASFLAWNLRSRISPRSLHLYLQLYHGPECIVHPEFLPDSGRNTPFGRVGELALPLLPARDGGVLDLSIYV